MVRVNKIKINSISPHLCSGVLDVAKPVLSWSFSGSEKNWIQASYTVRIKYSESGDQVFEYGPIESNNSSEVEWPGRPVHSKETVSVAVQVTGTDQSRSEFSDYVEISAGILNNKWDTKFIAMENQKISTFENQATQEIMFRSPVVELGKKVKSAKVYSTALGVYQVEINGAKISEDYLAPGWTSFNHRLLHQVYDVTSLLQKSSGTFVVGARVGSGWFSGVIGCRGGANNIWGDKKAISLELDVVYEDGTSETVLKSDDKWKSHEGPILDSQIYNGEKYDARLEVPGWSEVGTSTKNWSKVVHVKCPAAKIVPQSFGYITIVDRLSPVSIFKSNSGKTIVDFGQNAVGFVQFQRVKAPAGHVITLRHAEVMEDGELGTRPLRFAKNTNTYTFKGDSEGETYEPRFTYAGFRYVEVTGWPAGELQKSDLELHVLMTDMAVTGSFECSNPKLNRLYQNVFHSTRGNFLSIPTDCPQRDERFGWTGDIAVFCPTSLYMFDCYSFLRSWLDDVKSEQDEFGGYCGCITPEIHYALHDEKSKRWQGAYMAIWQDAMVMVPYQMYMYTSNKEILRLQYESMKTWVDFIPKIEGKVRWAQVKMQLGDWLDPSAPPSDPSKAMTDPYLVADAFLYLVITELAKSAQILGNLEDAKKYFELGQKCKSDFYEAYVTPEGKLVNETQTAYALAITFDLLSPEHVPFAGTRLSDLAQKNQFKIATGFAGTAYVAEALSKAHQSDSAYKMLLQEKCPSWLYPVTMGATTIWERWDSMLENGKINPGQMTSFNHYALGAVAQWMHERIGGVVAEKPGFQEILLRPEIGGGLTHAQTTHEAPQGTIKSSWSLQKDVFTYDVTVPHNTSATVVLPNGERVCVGSGTYSFSATV